MFSTVVDAHLNGGSLLKNVSYEQESHQLGHDIFTKVITSANNHVTFTLPKNDNWIDFWTGEQYRGGTVISKEYPLDRFPLFLRNGSIIPMKIDGSLTGIGDATMLGKEVLLFHPEDRKMSLTYYSPRNEGIEYDNVNVEYSPFDGKLQLMSDRNKDFVLIFRNMDSVKDVTGNFSSWHYNKKERELQVLGSGSVLHLEIN